LNYTIYDDVEENVYDFYYGSCCEDIIKYFNKSVIPNYNWSCGCTAKYDEHGEVIKTHYCDCEKEQIIDYMYYELEMTWDDDDLINPPRILIDVGYQFIFRKNEITDIQKVVDDCYNNLCSVCENPDEYMVLLLNSYCKAETKDECNTEIFEESPKLVYASLVLFGRNILKVLKDHEVCQILFKEW
jgi:hypothetical protein